jgi:hypothetical protein
MYGKEQCLSRSVILCICSRVPNAVSIYRVKWNQCRCSRTLLVLLFRAIKNFTELTNRKQTCLLLIVSARSVKERAHINIGMASDVEQGSAGVKVDK